MKKFRRLGASAVALLNAYQVFAVQASTEITEVDTGLAKVLKLVSNLGFGIMAISVVILGIRIIATHHMSRNEIMAFMAIAAGGLLIAAGAKIADFLSNF